MRRDTHNDDLAQAGTERHFRLATERVAPPAGWAAVFVLVRRPGTLLGVTRLADPELMVELEATAVA